MTGPAGGFVAALEIGDKAPVAVPQTCEGLARGDQLGVTLAAEARFGRIG